MSFSKRYILNLFDSKLSNTAYAKKAFDYIASQLKIEDDEKI